jgi:uncharacterized protein YqeY
MTTTQSLQERIEQDFKDAMRQKDDVKKSLLRVVIGEFSRDKESKILSDEKAIKVIKKMMEDAQTVNRTDEIKILKEYLPSQLTSDQLICVISQLIEDKAYTSLKDMGKIMNDLKAEFPGRYDGKVASEIIKNRLK